MLEEPISYVFKCTQKMQVECINIFSSIWYI